MPDGLKQALGLYISSLLFRDTGKKKGSLPSFHLSSCGFYSPTLNLLFTHRRSLFALLGSFFCVMYCVEVEAER
jgi:hypothetical protein